MIKGKKILIGISGGIAVYKVCSLINTIKKYGGESRVIMTVAATKFVTPLTFQSLTNAVVHVDMFDTSQRSEVEHIVLADWCDLMLLVPATYNTINKVANGSADNLLLSVTCAIPPKIPIIIAPAMNCHMWENPILQENIKKLKTYKIEGGTKKYTFIQPKTGQLVCGYEGEGVLSDTETIIETIDKSL